MKKTDDMLKYEIDILLKEYEHRFDEMKYHTSRYHIQSNYTYTYITILIAIASFLLSYNGFFDNTLLGLKSFFIFLILIFVLIVAYYLYTLMQDALCMIYINGSRIGAIEKLINHRLKSNLLTWDSKIISKYHSSTWIIKGWIKPSFIMVFWAFLMTLVLTMILCLICYSLANNYFWYYCSISLFLLILNLWQTISLNTIGGGFISMIVNNDVEHELNNEDDLIEDHS